MATNSGLSTLSSPGSPRRCPWAPAATCLSAPAGPLKPGRAPPWAPGFSPVEAEGLAPRGSASARSCLALSVPSPGPRTRGDPLLCPRRSAGSTPSSRAPWRPPGAGVESWITSPRESSDSRLALSPGPAGPTCCLWLCFCEAGGPSLGGEPACLGAGPEPWAWVSEAKRERGACPRGLQRLRPASEGPSSSSRPFICLRTLVSSARS